MATIHPVTFDDIEKLGVDENNQLYWHGKPIVTKERIILEWWVNLAVIIAAFSTFGSSMIELLKYIN